MLIKFNNRHILPYLGVQDQEGAWLHFGDERSLFHGGHIKMRTTIHWESWAIGVMSDLLRKCDSVKIHQSSEPSQTSSLETIWYHQGIKPSISKTRQFQSIFKDTKHMWHMMHCYHHCTQWIYHHCSTIYQYLISTSKDYFNCWHQKHSYCSPVSWYWRFSCICHNWSSCLFLPWYQFYACQYLPMLPSCLLLPPFVVWIVRCTLNQDADFIAIQLQFYEPQWYTSLCQPLQSPNSWRANLLLTIDTPSLSPTWVFFLSINIFRLKDPSPFHSLALLALFFSPHRCLYP